MHRPSAIRDLIVLCQGVTGCSLANSSRSGPDGGWSMEYSFPSDTFRGRDGAWKARRIRERHKAYGTANDIKTDLHGYRRRVRYYLATAFGYSTCAVPLVKSTGDRERC